MPLSLNGSGGITYPDGTVNTTRSASTAGDTFTGQVKLQNVALDLQSGQIKFPAAQVASSDPNTLDDYEEGTWTPTLSGSTGAPTVSYNNQGGTYVKIGRLVAARFWINVASRSGGTGNSVINNLPFTAENNNHWGCSISAYGLFTSAGAQSGFITANTANLSFITFASTLSDATVPIGNWGANTYVYGTVLYMTNN